MPIQVGPIGDRVVSSSALARIAGRSDVMYQRSGLALRLSATVCAEGR